MYVAHKHSTYTHLFSQIVYQWIGFLLDAYVRTFVLTFHPSHSAILECLVSLSHSCCRHMLTYLQYALSGYAIQASRRYTLVVCSQWLLQNLCVGLHAYIRNWRTELGLKQRTVPCKSTCWNHVFGGLSACCTNVVGNRIFIDYMTIGVSFSACIGTSSALRFPVVCIVSSLAQPPKSRCGG